MKKRYIAPIMEKTVVQYTLLAGSGPKGGDSSLPQVNEKESEGVKSYLIQPHLWDPEEPELEKEDQ